MRWVSALAVLFSVILHAEAPAKTRVFIAGPEPVTTTGETVVGDSRGSVEVTRSAPSYDIESMRPFVRYCPAVVVTTNRDKADVIVRVELRGDPRSTRPLLKGHAIAVFNPEGDLVFVTQARLLSNATKNACRFILDYANK